jgi:hypothetical protein
MVAVKNMISDVTSFAEPDTLWQCYKEMIACFLECLLVEKRKRHLGWVAGFPVSAFVPWNTPVWQNSTIISQIGNNIVMVKHLS